jgi:putative N6-adenine-specific DNA methylase
VLGAELASLGIRGTVEPGGVSWTGGETALVRANLWLRTAARVLVRASEFHARTFFELERHAKQIAWERWLAPGAAVRFRVTSRKSRLYHTEALAQRLGEAVAKRVRGSAIARVSNPGDEEDGDDDERAQLVVVRALRDRITVSVDSSGAHLHRRGYRQAVGKAPLRETLAAALLLATGWSGDVPLVDPLCGSGTIPIEGALIARRIAPGLHREFAFTRWPETDRATLERALDEAREAVRRHSTVPIAGSDRDAGAIASARANAERAGVAEDVEFAELPLSAARPPARAAAPGLIATNPPYGVRIGETAGLRDLYAQLGKLAGGPFSGWRVALFSASAALDGQLGIPLQELARTTNGGLPVRVVASAR